MVLYADDVRGRRYLASASAASLSPKPKVLALKNETLVEGAHQLIGVAEVLVITQVLARQQGMDGVMEIIAPHSVHSITTRLSRTDVTNIVLIRLRHHRDLA